MGILEKKLAFHLRQHAFSSTRFHFRTFQHLTDAVDRLESPRDDRQHRIELHHRRDDGGDVTGEEHQIAGAERQFPLIAQHRAGEKNA